MLHEALFPVVQWFEPSVREPSGRSLERVQLARCLSMKYRSFRRFGMLLATALPACGAPEESEWLGSTSAALTGTDLTPTSIANVSDLRNVPAGVEGLDKVFDNNIATKLFLRHSSETIQYRMAKPSTIVSYDIKSGNDYPERDPKTWKTKRRSRLAIQRKSSCNSL